MNKDNVNVFILHSLNGGTTRAWGKDICNLMGENNVDCYMPLFPIKEDASFEKFDKELSKYLNDNTLNENSIVIAHSIGNPYFIRFASKHNYIPKVYISVAGCDVIFPTERKDYFVDTIANAIPTREDVKFVKDNIKEKYSLYSDDHLIDIKLLKNFVINIDSKDMYLKGYDHFSESRGIYQIKELNELLERLIK